jgi:hypothetical protein
MGLNYCNVFLLSLFSRICLYKSFLDDNDISFKLALKVFC